MLSAYGREGSWSARVRAGLDALLENFDSEPGLARLCVVETLRAGPGVLEHRKRVLDALVVAIDEGRAESRSKNDPPPLTAQGVAGGVLSVIHARLLEDGPRPLVELTSPLMAMIVHPYLGSAAAHHELEQPTTGTHGAVDQATGDPFKDLAIRFTYRTALVLETIAAEGGQGSHPSNREIAETSGIVDEGQMSRLLQRLRQAGLDQKPRRRLHTSGVVNAWTLTQRGQAVQAALAGG